MAQTRHRETALAKPFPGLQRHTAIVSQPTTSFIASQEEACATHWARHPAIFANEISDQTPQWTKVPGRGNSLGRCLRLHQGPGNGSASWSISGAPCWGKAGCTETGMHLWIAALKPGHLRYEKNSLDKARIWRDEEHPVVCKVPTVGLRTTFKRQPVSLFCPPTKPVKDPRSGLGGGWEGPETLATTSVPAPPSFCSPQGHRLASRGSGSL